MSDKKPASGLITLRQSHWLYVTTLLLLSFFYVMTAFDSYKIYDAVYRAYAAPRVRRQFGFRMERRRMYYRNTQPLDVFVITELEPSGVLAEAGARNSDVPVGWRDMSDVEFCQKLWRSRGGAVEIHLINSEEYEKLLKTGDLHLLPDRDHKIVIPRQPGE